jgi:hypothetical protein
MELKTAFILQALNQYNQKAIAQMRDAMHRAHVGVSEEGYNSLAYKAFQRGEGAYSNLSFNEYLRFVDMGAGRGHPLGGLASVAVALQASKKQGLSQVKDKVRKPKKIYSKIVYGNLGYLYGKLLYGYTQETIDALNELQQNNINN